MTSKQVASRRSNQEQNSNDLLTVQEVADILRVDSTTVRRWVKQGVLEAIVLPHLNDRQVFRIRRETLDNILEESTESAHLERQIKIV